MRITQDMIEKIVRDNESRMVDNSEQDMLDTLMENTPLVLDAEDIRRIAMYEMSRSI